MKVASEKGFVFTGWHMLGVMVLFFGTIISVNVYMAYHAFTSWSGLVVENTYVASQQFNKKVEQERALIATGVSGRVLVNSPDIRYEIVDANGSAVAADTMTLHFKRPVGDHQDFQITLVPAEKGIYQASHPVLPGHWIVEATAERSGTVILHHSERISVQGAAQ